MPEFREISPLVERITNPTLKSTLKYRKYPSVIAIGDLNIRLDFRFSLVSIREVFKEIKKINPQKVAQSTDVPDVLKDNANIFADFISGFFNESINSCKFPSILKHANVTPVFKKGYRGSKETIALLAHYLLSRRFLKKYYVNNLQYLQIKISKNISVVLERATVRNIHYQQCWRDGKVRLIIRKCLDHF